MRQNTLWGAWAWRKSRQHALTKAEQRKYHFVSQFGAFSGWVTWTKRTYWLNSCQHISNTKYNYWDIVGIKQKQKTVTCSISGWISGWFTVRILLLWSISSLEFLLPFGHSPFSNHDDSFPVNICPWQFYLSSSFLFYFLSCFSASTAISTALIFIIYTYKVTCHLWLQTGVSPRGSCFEHLVLSWWHYFGKWQSFRNKGLDVGH